ncbi:carbohydrate ABC transporter permease [Breznakiella homolactica]|uniref:Carbohydrate ABC transporter permease n=1 Tax=Breznakiella homolactica TaxID=2798577 RepID=A0A7T8BB89_9SPIR|nr:carbohydrate ABC transporter permease [Breznakiella homolactica]QQO10161.1 carbohydrate ABC transporter permease [Breznakiella homolactica]
MNNNQKALLRRKIGDIGVYAVLLAFSALVLIPVLWMVSTAFKSNAETMTVPPVWIPKHIDFNSFKRLWIAYPFATFFKNSIIVVLASMIICVFCSCLAGYGVTRFKFRGRNSLMAFVLITQMFPSVMLLVPFYSVINSLGLINTHMGLILVYISFTTPFCTWMMMGFFKSLPLDLDEAATIDGCNAWQTFYKVILPLTLPGIASTSLYSFITSWNEYMFAFILTNSAEMRTISVGIAELNGFQQILWNDMMAASLIASVPLIVLFVCLQKYFVSGLTSGAVKT